MAREIVVRLRDDIDGSEAAETVRFGFRGQEYEIELSEQHLKELEEALSPFVEHGRQVKGVDGKKKRGGRQPRQAATARTSRAAELAVVREWARANG